MKQVKRYNFFWISLKKRWNLQQNLQQFTVYWPLAEKPWASVYFKGALHTGSEPPSGFASSTVIAASVCRPEVFQFCVLCTSAISHKCKAVLRATTNNRKSPASPLPYWTRDATSTMGAHRALCPRCARAVREIGCFPPPVAPGPRVLNPAPYSPCWYTSACHGSQGPESCTLQPLLVHQCLPRVPGS